MLTVLCFGSNRRAIFYLQSTGFSPATARPPSQYGRLLENEICSKENLDFEDGDYEIPNNWKEDYKESLKFPSNQVALGFKIK